MKSIFLWILLGLSVVLFALGLYFFLVEPLFEPMVLEEELIYYARVFLVLMAVLVFASLRAYNAVVGNTRFLIKLREVLVSSTRENQNLQRKLTSAKDSSLKLSDSVKELTKTIKASKSEDSVMSVKDSRETLKK